MTFFKKKDCNFFMYLKDKKRQCLLSPDHSLNAQNSHGCAMLQPRAMDSTWVFHLVNRTPSTWAIHHLLITRHAISRDPDWKRSSQYLIWHFDMSCCYSRVQLNLCATMLAPKNNFQVRKINNWIPILIWTFTLGMTLPFHIFNLFSLKHGNIILI